MYKINILIHNKHGELLDKQFSFETLDEMRNLDVNKLVNEAEDYAKENLMLEEELFDSKEEAIFNQEDTSDSYREQMSREPNNNVEPY